MNNFASGHQRGFTLLEIMVSLVLICLVVVSVIQLSSANLRNLSASDDRIETLRRASEKMRQVLDGDLSEDKTWNDVD
ncbi:MAG: type II secretion system protein, partial [Smithellaceae bacterium]